MAPLSGARARPRWPALLRESRRTARGGPSCALHRVPAELVAEGGDDLGAEGIALAGAKPGQQREGDDGCGHIEGDRFLNGPAAFTRVFHIALERGELHVVRKGTLGELVEPRADHAPAVPDRGDLVQVQLE